MPDVIIRKAKKADASTLVALAADFAAMERKRSRFTKRHFLSRGFGKGKLFTTLMAVLNKQIIGYALFHNGYDVQSASGGIYLADLFVVKEYRGMNIGKQLLKAVSDHCKNEGGQWICWHVNRSNHRALRFYKSIKAGVTANVQMWISTGAASKIRIRRVAGRP